MGNGSFFLEKKKEPKKNRLCPSPVWLTVIRFRIMVFFIRDAAYDYRFNPLSCAAPAAKQMPLALFSARSRQRRAEAAEHIIGKDADS